MTTYTRDALLAVAVGLRVWYLVVLWGLNGGEFFGNWLRYDLPLAAAGNAIAVGVIVAGRLLRREVVVWVGCAAALALQLLPGARVGLTAMQLLPWVTAATTGVMLLTAIRLGGRYVAASAVFVIVGLAWLAWSVRLAALDYYIALAAMWLVVSTLSAMRALPIRSAR